MRYLKKILVLALFGFISNFSFAQNIDKIITLKETERIESTLSSDDMEGRASFTPGNDKAADFIQNEFRKIGLQSPNSNGSYLQEFFLIKAKISSAFIKLDDATIDPNNIAVFSSSSELSITENSGYNIGFIKTGGNFNSEAGKFRRSEKNYLVFVNSSFANDFKRMSQHNRPVFESNFSTIFVLSDANPKSFSINVKQDISKQRLANVVGILPGKSKANEFVIFSGHYDHLGIGKPDEKGDSIYNGANDDASGSTAVIMLAKYFKKLQNNERTLIFATFTAEEIGGYGSQYFSKQYDPAKVVAMFNIEMIGTESKWGTNSAYITGYEKTDMGDILKKNLAGSKFSFHPDPYTDQNLFYRSDNATLARQGVPAHTISTSKMDAEPNYHKQSDEIGTLDLKNMTEIIKAIAVSSTSIVLGNDTPTRVDASSLK